MNKHLEAIILAYPTLLLIFAKDGGYMFIRRLLKLIGILMDPVLLIGLIKGAAAGLEHKRLLENLQCDFVVDVGANSGQFALIARRVYPYAKIISFEPLERPAKVFRRIFASDKQVILYPYAIGSEEKDAIFHVSKKDHSSSLLGITSTQERLFPGTTEIDKQKVKVLPLWQVLEGEQISPKSLLKIDVQGSELNVLIGSESIIDKFKFIYVECSFMELYEGQALAHQIISWLNQRDFHITGIYNLYFDKTGNTIQGDFLFRKNN